MLASLASIATAQSSPPTSSVHSSPVSANQLFVEHKFKDAFELATTELNKTPANFQLLYVAGAAACELKEYDTGLEYLLEAIRAYPNGIRNEYREALEGCVIKKTPPVQPPAPPSASPKPPETASQAVFPAGRSVSMSNRGGCGDGDYAGAREEVVIAIQFNSDWSVQYARSAGCGGKPKVLKGTWTRTGQLLSMGFYDEGSPWLLSAKITSDHKITFLEHLF